MTTSTPFDERQYLKLLGLAGFASMASMRIGDPMLVVLGQEFQVSTGEASGVVSVFAVVYGLMQLFYGPLGERFGKLRVVSLAVAACALLSAITALSVNLPMLLVMRGLMGAAAAGIIPLSMAWVGDQVPYERRQETLAKLMSATVIGMMSGLWFGGFAADTLGWRSAFVLLAVMFAWPALLLWRARQKAPAPAATQPPSLIASFRLTGQLLGTPRVRLILTVTAAEGALVFGALAFMPTHLHQQYGLSVVVRLGHDALWRGRFALQPDGAALAGLAGRARPGAHGGYIGHGRFAGLGLGQWCVAGDDGLPDDGLGLLHAAQHAAGASHPNGPGRTRKRCDLVRLLAVFWPIHRGAAHGPKRGHGLAGLCLHGCGDGGGGVGRGGLPLGGAALSSRAVLVLVRVSEMRLPLL
jgi:MFS family permease